MKKSVLKVNVVDDVGHDEVGDAAPAVVDLACTRVKARKVFPQLRVPDCDNTRWLSLLRCRWLFVYMPVCWMKTWCGNRVWVHLSGLGVDRLCLI